MLLLLFGFQNFFDFSLDLVSLVLWPRGFKLAFALASISFLGIEYKYISVVKYFSVVLIMYYFAKYCHLRQRGAIDVGLSVSAYNGSKPNEYAKTWS